MLGVTPQNVLNSNSRLSVARASLLSALPFLVQREDGKMILRSP